MYNFFQNVNKLNFTIDTCVYNCTYTTQLHTYDTVQNCIILSKVLSYFCTYEGVKFPEVPYSTCTVRVQMKHTKVFPYEGSSPTTLQCNATYCSSAYLQIVRAVYFGTTLYESTFVLSKVRKYESTFESTKVLSKVPSCTSVARLLNTFVRKYLRTKVQYCTFVVIN